MTGAGEPDRLDAAFVSQRFFATLGVAPQAGRLPVADEFVLGRDRVAVVSDSYWRSHFGGNRSVVGSVARIENQPFTLVGVMPASFTFPSPEVDVWIPISRITDDDIPHLRGLRWQSVVGRLAPGQTAESAGAAATAVTADLERTYKDTNDGYGQAMVLPLSDTIVGGSRRALLILLAAVGLVLLVACANVANLLAARAAGRQREIAVRAALGASRPRLIGLLLTESLVLALIGGAAGVLLAIWGVEALSSIGADRIPRWVEVSVDPLVLGFAAAAALLSGLLAGLLPAWRLLRKDPSAGFAARGEVTSQGSWRLLVAAETALTAVLLVGAALLSRSVWQLVSTNPGFRAENVLAISTTIQDETPPYYGTPRRLELIKALRALPGVVAAGASKTMPLSGGGEPYDPTTLVDGRRVRIQPEGGTMIVTDGYFEALAIPVVRGRAMTAEDFEARNKIVVVNAALAKSVYGNVDKAVGQRLRFGEDEKSELEIVGVVGDVRHLGLTKPAPPVLYMPATRAPRSTMKIYLRSTQDPAALAAAARDVVRRFDADLPVYGVQTLTQVVRGEAATMRLLGGLLLFFGAVAMLLAALGVGGAVAWAISRRTREIGVRMALGSTMSQVVGLFVRRGAAPAAAGIAAGLLLAAAASRALSGVLYEISPLDPSAYAAAAIFLAVATLLAAYLPARRAARVDPSTALRSE
jgi:predicted permease